MIRYVPFGLPLLAFCIADGVQAQATDGGALDRAAQVTDAVHRSGAAQRCWNAFLQANPDSGSVRLRVRIDLAANGRVDRVAFLEPAPLALTACVRTELRRLSMPAGTAVSIETTYSFAAGMPAPVPAEH